MQHMVPHYYKDFTCIASACSDNCCIGGWEIDIDDETAAYYKSLPGEFGDRLRAAICHTDEYCFKLDHGRCPFLDAKNLCEIYQTLGADQMGVVCSQFPRYTEYYGAVKETGIGLACEEAERLIFSDRSCFHLVTLENDTEEPLNNSEYDAQLGDALMILRKKFFALAEYTDIDIFTKLQIMIDTGSKLQQIINRNDYSAISDFCNTLNIKKNIQVLQSTQTNPCPISAVSDLENKIARVLYAYLELEVLNDDWEHTLDHVLNTLHPEDDSVSDDAEHSKTTFNYAGISAEFMTYIAPRAYEYDNLIKYYLFRYLMKASYDYDLFGKIQLIAANFLVILDFDITCWLEHQKCFTVQDRIDTVHIFSREVEYSEDNLWTLTEAFIFDDIFTADSLCMLFAQLHKNLINKG